MVAIVTISVGFFVLRFVEARNTDVVNSFLDIRTIDLSAASLRDHITRTYPDDSEWILPRVEDAVSTHSKGQLFHCNSSKKDWKNQGGKEGCAIIQDKRIVWYRSVRKS